MLSGFIPQHISAVLIECVGGEKEAIAPQSTKGLPATSSLTCDARCFLAKKLTKD
jgi:hypothetical protein